MKWITHQTGAVLGALALGLPLPAIVAASAGAVFPDVIDQRLSRLGGEKNRQKIFNKIHRGASHWFGWWLALMLIVFSWPFLPIAQDALAGFALGSLSHVGMDMFTPQGIPLSPFSRKGKLALPLCKTGKWSEWIFLGVILTCGAVFLQAELKLALASVKNYF